MIEQKDIDELVKARDIIFKVEQKWREEGLEYAGHTLFISRVAINASMGRGQKGKYKPSKERDIEDKI